MNRRDTIAAALSLLVLGVFACSKPPSVLDDDAGSVDSGGAGSDDTGRVIEDVGRPAIPDMTSDAAHPDVARSLDAAAADLSAPPDVRADARTVDPACTGRSTDDRPDDVDGFQLHAVYAVAADGEDRGYDVDGSIDRSVASFNEWLSRQTGGSKLRLDTCDGRLDVTFVRLASDDATIAASGAFVRDEVEAEVNAMGLNDPAKLYLVYYDGTSTYACGGAPYPPDLIGNVAALYLRGFPDGPVPCDSNGFTSRVEAPTYREFAMLHETLHALGLVARCAPNHHRDGHSSDASNDLMYAGDQPWQPSILDVGNDDYWNHGRADCLDLADSAFLDPLPAQPEPPPGW